MTQRRIVTNGHLFLIQELLPVWWLLWLGKQWVVYCNNYTELPHYFGTRQESEMHIKGLEQEENEYNSPFDRVT